MPRSLAIEVTHDDIGVEDCHEKSATVQLVLWTGQRVKQGRFLVLQGAEGMLSRQEVYGIRSHI